MPDSGTDVHGFGGIMGGFFTKTKCGGRFELNGALGIFFANVLDDDGVATNVGYIVSSIFPLGAYM